MSPDGRQVILTVLANNVDRVVEGQAEVFSTVCLASPTSLLFIRKCSVSLLYS